MTPDDSWPVPELSFADATDAISRGPARSSIEPVTRDRHGGAADQTRRPRPEPLLHPRSPARVLKRFPVTMAIFVQYSTLVLWPALHDGNTDKGFVYEITLIGLGVTFGAELLLLRVRTDRGRERFIDVRRAGCVAVTGAVLILASTRLGVGVYGYGVAPGLKTASALSSLFTPFTSWEPIGLALMFYAYRRQPEERRTILAVTGAVLVIELFTVLLTSTTVQFFQLLFVIGVLMVVSGFIRARWLVVGLVVVVAGWPTLEAFRNSNRAAVTSGNPFTVPQDPYRRIEDDNYLAYAKVVKAAGESPAGVPSYGLILQAGLIPRALQPGRPVIETATLLNEATGGNGRSSETLTTFGEVWLLHGTSGLVVTCAALAAVGNLLARHRSPYAFVLLAGVVSQLVWIETTFPDAIAGFLQFAVSGGVALILFRPMRGRLP